MAKGVKLRLPIAYFLLLLATDGQSVTFGSGIDATWSFERRDGDCLLTHAVEQFGEARFVARSGIDPAFELQARQDWFAGANLRVIVEAPAWHRAFPARREAGTAVHIAGGGAIVRGALADELLLALRDGFDVAIESSTRFDASRPVSVTIPATRIQGAYDAFSACAHTNVNVSWQLISRTRITYETDEYEITPAGDRVLEGIVQFVAQDASVTRVFVDGHTDDSGTRLGNARLSKKRAETVAKRLEELGLKSEIVVRYHGAAYPVGDNATFTGKAANRRTTVRLQRDEKTRVARR